MNTRELLQMALDALWDCMNSHGDADWSNVDATMNALRAHLAKPDETAELLREMGAVLGKNEWITYDDPDWGEQVFCPECGRDKKLGHSSDPKCGLANALAKIKEMTK